MSPAHTTSALPNSYFWTWDHSTNWVLDDPGIQNEGCFNSYLKRPETFVEDYRRLTDLAASLGVKGIVIWGFLRDSHGGIDAAKRVADYAASKGVAIMPGVGLTWYGGVYYEGDHRFNIATFLKKHPDAKLHAELYAGEVGACPTHPAFLDWMREGLDWLFREFRIGGVNLENGDFIVCECERCRAQKASWPADDTDFFRMQAITYVPAVEALRKQLHDKLVTWATYTSFSFGLPTQTPDPRWPSIGSRVPEITRRINPLSIAQWTLTGVVRAAPLPLSAYLDDGAPAEALDNPWWPRALLAPAQRSVGFLHQGSQWTALGPTGRYQQIISTIKEGCLRAHRAAFEGVSIHGEVTSRYVPWALNYLAFSHFTRRPEDTLREFGRRTLGPALGGEGEGETFIETLAQHESGTVTDARRREVHERSHKLDLTVARGERAALGTMHFWRWLHGIIEGRTDRHTVGFF